MTRRVIVASGLSLFIVLGTVIGVVITGLVTAHGDNPDSIHACVDSKGQVRIVAPDNDCSSLKGKSWKPVDWPASDVDTVLTELQVEGFITNGPLDLDNASTLGLQPISTGSHTTSLDWSALTGVPADIADGDDDTDTNTDTLAGLSCSTDQLARWDGSAWECFFDGPTITKYHAPGINGEFTSMAIGSDGLPIFSFFDRENREIRIAHCENTKCTSATFSTVDTLNPPGIPEPPSTSIAIAGDGLAIITYIDPHGGNNNPTLFLAHCDDINCSNSNIVAIDSFSSGLETDIRTRASVVTGTDGFGLIAYNAPNSADELRVIHCEDFLCSSRTVNSLDGSVVDGAAIAIGTDGFGFISYQIGTADGLKVAHCTNISCSSADLFTPGISSSIGIDGNRAEVAIGSDGYPIIVHSDNKGKFRVTHCDNIACSLSTNSVLYRSANGPFSMAVGSDDLLIIVYSFGEPVIAHCENLSCSDVIQNFINDTEGQSTKWSAIAIGRDGLPIISYYDGFREDLKVAHCPDPVTCGPQ